MFVFIRIAKESVDRTRPYVRMVFLNDAFLMPCVTKLSLLLFVIKSCNIIRIDKGG